MAKKYTTVTDLRARRAEVAALAQRHAENHDSKATLPTARRYAERLARLDARIAAAEADERDAAREEGAAEFHAVVAEQDARRARAPRQTQNFLHGEALDPAHEAYCDEQAALSRYENARPDHDTRDREGRDEPLQADPARSATERGGAVVVASSVRHIVIEDATPAYEGTVLKSRHVLSLAGTYYRFGVGGIPRGQSGRKVFQGPLVPGPWAFAFGLGSTISANPEMSTGAEIRRNSAEGIEHVVEAGDRVTFDGVTYTVAVERRQFINLVAEVK